MAISLPQVYGVHVHHNMDLLWCRVQRSSGKLSIESVAKGEDADDLSSCLFSRATYRYLCIMYVHFHVNLGNRVHTIQLTTGETACHVVCRHVQVVGNLVLSKR